MKAYSSLRPRIALLTLATLVLAVPALSGAEDSKAGAGEAQSAPIPSVETSESATEGLNTHEAELVGLWGSDDTSRGAAAGTMSLTAHRHLKLQLKPIGTLEVPALEGTWSADAEYLYLEVASRGKARLAYELSDGPRSLEVQYENGMAQTFTPADPGAATTPAATPVLP